MQFRSSCSFNCVAPMFSRSNTSNTNSGCDCRPIVCTLSGKSHNALLNSAGSSSKPLSLCSAKTSRPLSLNGVPSGKAPVTKDHTLVSLCFPSTTSSAPFRISWKNIVGIGMFSMRDSSSLDAVRTVRRTRAGTTAKQVDLAAVDTSR